MGSDGVISHTAEGPVAVLHQGAPPGRSTALAPALPIALLCFGDSLNRK